MDFLSVDLDLFKMFCLTIALSGLIGLQREKIAVKGEFSLFAGFRSFILIAILGLLAGLLVDYYVYISVLISFVVFSLILAAYVLGALKFKRIGTTTEFSAVLTFLIAFFISKELFLFSLVLTLFLVAILQFKETLHSWVKSISSRELISALQFIFLAFVLLPILPNQYFGPFAFFNPYVVWLMFVLISGISLFSYFLVKFLGQKKGILISGFFAGLISSTALTLSFAGESKRRKNIVNPFAAAIIIAGSAMFFRVLVEVAIINFDLFLKVILPFSIMGAVGLLSSLYFLLKKEADVSPLNSEDVENPLKLWPAVKFATLFAVILLVNSYANYYFGHKGVYFMSFFSAILDVDAISVSISEMANHSLDINVARTAIIIAVLTNTFSKAFLFLFLGNKVVAKRVFLVYLLMALVGVFFML